MFIFLDNEWIKLVHFTRKSFLKSKNKEKKENVVETNGENWRQCEAQVSLFFEELEKFWIKNKPEVRRFYVCFILVSIFQIIIIRYNKHFYDFWKGTIVYIFYFKDNVQDQSFWNKLYIFYATSIDLFTQYFSHRDLVF